MAISDLVPTDPPDSAQVSETGTQLRLIKQALIDCFENLDGLVVNTSGDSPTATEWSALFTAVEELTSNAGVGTVPYGAIMMYNGATAPAGWAICDGASYTGSQGAVNTPDLRGKFIVGHISGDPNFDFGQTGGSLTTDNGGDGTVNATINIPDHVLTIDNFPEHRHQVFSIAETNNTNGFPGPSSPLSSGSSASYAAQGANSDRAYVIDTDSATDASIGRTSAAGIVNPEPLTHNADAITIDGIEHTHDYQPPYYAAVYIMYIGVAP